MMLGFKALTTEDEMSDVGFKALTTEDEMSDAWHQMPYY